MIKNLLLILSCFSISAFASETDVLANIYSQLQQADGPGHPLENITYGLTYKNAFSSDGSFLTLYPGNIWGQQVKSIPTYNFHTGQGFNSDFGLPYCDKDQDCKVSGAICQHLSAFNNAIPASQKMCTGIADRNLDSIYNLITSAKKFVDITTLEKLPDQRFKSTFRDALTTLAKSGRPITVRILYGIYVIPVKKNSAQSEKTVQQEEIQTTKQWLEDVTRDVKNIPNSHLSIDLAGMRSCSGFYTENECSKGAPGEYMSFSWNHSKIIDVDGTSVMTGGVNMFSTDYLNDDPVFDLMATVHGPVAQKTLGFTNMLWKYVNENMRKYPLDIIEYSYKGGEITQSNPAPYLDASLPLGSGDVEILSVGRTGAGILPNGKEENSSDLALYLMLSQAKKSIFLAQQSLNGSFNTWPFNTVKDASGNLVPHTSFISALSRLLIRGGNVNIVISPYSKIPVALGDGSLSFPAQIWEKIKDETKALAPSTQTNVAKLLCGHLHISTIRFNQDNNTWQDGKKIFVHYKFMMTDSHLFYYGAQNFYPSGLQNFGYIVDSPSTAAMVKNNFWDKLWGYSDRTEYNAPDCNQANVVINFKSSVPTTDLLFTIGTESKWLTPGQQWKPKLLNDQNYALAGSTNVLDFHTRADKHTIIDIDRIGNTLFYKSGK